MGHRRKNPGETEELKSKMGTDNLKGSRLKSGLKHNKSKGNLPLD